MPANHSAAQHGGQPTRACGVGGHGKVGQWVRLIAPGLVDRIAKRAIEEGK